MKKVIKISIIILLLNLPLQFKAEESVRAKEEKVIVVASRIPVKEMDIGRDVIIITKEEIEKLPVRTVQELLKYFLDFQERGSFGVQADVSIRGSTFQQVLVLLDGVRINDLQTAHHNMDIPVPLESIERIEILNGNGSSLFGADAFGGVINIVTKDPIKVECMEDLAFMDIKHSQTTLALKLKKKIYQTSYLLKEIHQADLWRTGTSAHSQFTKNSHGKKLPKNLHFLPPMVKRILEPMTSTPLE
ncbi:MAG: TonB-dependent receptor [Candidatus Aminicenantia bacterium]